MEKTVEQLAEEEYPHREYLGLVRSDIERKAFIKGYQAKEEREWIKCSDKLPESDVDVTTFGDEGMFFGAHFEDGQFKDNMDYPLIGITHWMPLPPLPTAPK